MDREAARFPRTKANKRRQVYHLPVRTAQTHTFWKAGGTLSDSRTEKKSEGGMERDRNKRKQRKGGETEEGRQKGQRKDWLENPEGQDSFIHQLTHSSYFY